MNMIRMAIIFLLATIWAGGGASAGQARAPAEFHDVGGGWHEAWIGVSDLDRMRAFFEQVAGWRTTDEGAIDAATLAYLAPGATAGRYAVVRSADHPQGWVRLFELDGVDRRIVRSNAQAWDTGGVFSIMTRSADIVRNLQDAQALGWGAFNDPYDFGFTDAVAGDLRLRNIVLRGPDGVNVAIYEWVKPRSQIAPPTGSVSKAFNAMQMVKDIKVAKAFYTDVLGFGVLQAGEFVDPAPTPTNFALPVNLSTEVSREFAILVPEGGDTSVGRVELMHFAGLEGRDLSGDADLGGLGIVSLVFPRADLAEVEARIEAAGLSPAAGPAEVELPPFGRMRTVTVETPDGALMTFVAPVPTGGGSPP